MNRDSCEIRQVRPNFDKIVEIFPSLPKTDIIIASLGIQKQNNYTMVTECFGDSLFTG